MTQYLMSVWHSPDNPIPDDPAVMQRAFKQVDAFNAELQAAMVGKVWLSNCNSYYRHPSGKVVTQLPYSGRTFFERTRTMIAGDFALRA